jgi:hypothetical protein
MAPCRESRIGDVGGGREQGREDHWALGIVLTTVLTRVIRAIDTALPRPARRVIKMSAARVRLALGLQPLSKRWGDRGKPMHREYLEGFLQEFSSEIRGRCLEFEKDAYTSRFGGDAVTAVDILHKEEGNPAATIVADLTRQNEIQSTLFDCIICTQVLHVVVDVEKMISELHRILKSNGVLLLTVPHITICYPEHHELWRFTEEGLLLLLTKHFGTENVTVRGYGNSLTAAGWLRGLVARDFTRKEREYHDSRFSIILCAKAVKRNR